MKKNGKRLMRSADNRRILGVCGGIGEFFGISPDIVRIVMFLLVMVTRGFFVWAYFILGFILPQGESRQSRPDARPASEWREQWARDRQAQQHSEAGEWKRDAQEVQYQSDDCGQSDDGHVGQRSHRGEHYSEDDFFKESHRKKDDWS